MAKIGFDIEMLIALRNGMLCASKVIESSYGPRGRNIVCNDLMTGNGKEIMENLSLPEPFENTGARLLRRIARETHENFNDGSSTTVLLASELISGGVHAIASGIHPLDLNKGIHKAHAHVLEILKQNTIRIP